MEEMMTIEEMLKRLQERFKDWTIVSIEFEYFAGHDIDISIRAEGRKKPEGIGDITAYEEYGFGSLDGLVELLEGGRIDKGVEDG